MTITRFEDILAWQKSRALTKNVYSSLLDIADYSFRDQIYRASVSIMNNIAEGFERHTNKEFKHYLYISKGSCGEVRSMLYLAGDLKYIDSDTQNELIYSSTEVSKILSGLIKRL